MSLFWSVSSGPLCWIQAKGTTPRWKGLIIMSKILSWTDQKPTKQSPLRHPGVTRIWTATSAAAAVISMLWHDEAAEQMRQKHFHFVKLCGKREKLLHFSIPLHAPRTSGILKWIWGIEVRFPAQTLFMTPFFSLIRSRPNTMDELPNSPMLTGTERCSNVLPRPRHGLFIVFAEVVTLKNKSRWSFPAAAPLIRAAVRLSHLSAFESRSPDWVHLVAAC